MALTSSRSSANATAVPTKTTRVHRIRLTGSHPARGGARTWINSLRGVLGALQCKWLTRSSAYVGRIFAPRTLAGWCDIWSKLSAFDWVRYDSILRMWSHTSYDRLLEPWNTTAVRYQVFVRIACPNHSAWATSSVHGRRLVRIALRRLRDCHTFLGHLGILRLRGRSPALICGVDGRLKCNGLIWRHLVIAACDSFGRPSTVESGRVVGVVLQGILEQCWRDIGEPRSTQRAYLGVVSKLRIHRRRPSTDGKRPTPCSFNATRRIKSSIVLLPP
jgi:hypothetical protein